jgi:hypothetical protein
MSTPPAERERLGAFLFGERKPHPVLAYSRAAEASAFARDFRIVLSGDQPCEAHSPDERCVRLAWVRTVHGSRWAAER